MTTPTSDGKTTAIISYLWIIGLVIAFVMNSSKKDDFASYHIRNMIGICALGLGNSILNWIGIPRFLISGIWIVLLIIWVLGLISAIQGEKKEIPIVGAYFQEWFKSI